MVREGDGTAPVLSLAVLLTWKVEGEVREGGRPLGAQRGKAVGSALELPHSNAAGVASQL